MWFIIALIYIPFSLFHIDYTVSQAGSQTSEKVFFVVFAHYSLVFFYIQLFE